MAQYSNIMAIDIIILSANNLYYIIPGYNMLSQYPNHV